MKRLEKNLAYAVTSVATLLIATDAFARRSHRDGFNFGTNVRLMDADDRSESTAISDKSTRTQSTGTAFSPHVGYSFGEINLGLVANIENRKETINEQSSTSSQQMIRDAETNTKALSLFGRFNFGRVMFMEAGFGAYSQVTDVHTEYRLAGSDGSFTGKVEDYKVQGVGPGYHVGGGLELPVSNGFFFTTSYLVRAFTLRDQAKSEFGERIGTQQKRELSFGISYYN